ncbi:hypothetical protein M2352_003370 [Azospirillum fermentarium]|uniref:hypothetical protein n=1 Tax=Azospirillum fermentarium TaxID=1233114 RepID=UPI002225D890|nr:hypothetical protein [Azospirillum fermentarium]MCW2247736.1 hypothetical protein [Azospirillum fermentarium]
MCNPRRVLVQVNRAVDEAWQRLVTEQATASTEIRDHGRFTVDVALDTMMGNRALTVLERCLAGEFPEVQGWSRGDDGVYRQRVGAVTLCYRAGDSRMTVEAGMTELVSVEAQAEVEASGIVLGEVAAEAVCSYFDDGWGGYTEDRAREQARADADRRLASALDSLRREQQGQHIEAAVAQARSDAQAQADARLREQHDHLRAALRRRLQASLADAQDAVRHAINRLVGEVYRQTLIEIARQGGGRVVSDQRDGAVMELEIEL